MAKKSMTYNDLMELADAYSVRDNVMFQSASARYVQQVEVIEKINKSIAENGLMIAHVNVKGDENLDANPLVAQLPKHIDTANKTLLIMLDIIERLGHPAAVKNRFGDIDE